MLSSAIELINLTHDVSYAPTFVSTDKRIPAGGKTSLGYWRIGETQQYGYSYGPVFRVEFVNMGTADYVKIWGLENKDDDAVVYPKTYLMSATYANNKIDVYLMKFAFCDITGAVVSPPNTYSVIGHKKKTMPIAW